MLRAPSGTRGLRGGAISGSTDNTRELVGADAEACSTRVFCRELRNLAYLFQSDKALQINKP